MVGDRTEITRYAACYVILADNLLEKFIGITRPCGVAHGTLVDDCTRRGCACQAARNQAQSWWGTIDKFEAATLYWRVSIPLHYLRVREPLLRSDKPKPIKMPGPGCDKCKGESAHKYLMDTNGEFDMTFPQLLLCSEKLLGYDEVYKQKMDLCSLRRYHAIDF